MNQDLLFVLLFFLFHLMAHTHKKLKKCLFFLFFWLFMKCFTFIAALDLILAIYCNVEIMLNASIYFS